MPGGSTATNDVFLPETADELRGFMAENAASARRPLCPRGGGTMFGGNDDIPAAGVIVSTERLARLVDYPARDMTVTLEAGMTVQALADVLRGERQQLPIDVPQADRATVGGILAMNVSGPRRYGYGTLRDYVIGLSAVDGRGRLFSAGGRVVKNVAGYDLCKLLVGSRGTLAIITQVTFKLRPLPETTGLLWITFDRLASIDAALERLLTSDTRPVLLEILNTTAARSLTTAADQSLPSERPVLMIGVEGAAADVAWQLDRLQQELGPHGLASMDAIPHERSQRVLAALTESHTGTDAPLSFRANLPPSRTVAFLEQASQAGLAVQAHAGNGIVSGRLPDGIDTAAGAERLLRPLRQLARSDRGNLIVTRCPVEWRPHLPVFGEPEPAWPLMRRVKAALDPHQVLNPGGFLDAGAGTPV